jgi:hypothetical protein
MRAFPPALLILLHALDSFGSIALRYPLAASPGVYSFRPRFRIVAIAGDRVFSAFSTFSKGY